MLQNKAKASVTQDGNGLTIQAPSSMHKTTYRFGVGMIIFVVSIFLFECLTGNFALLDAWDFAALSKLLLLFILAAKLINLLLKMHFGKEILNIHNHQLTIQNTVSKNESTTVIPIAEIKKLTINVLPSYGIEGLILIHHSNDMAHFGSTLHQDDARRLIQLINTELFRLKSDLPLE